MKFNVTYPARLGSRVNVPSWLLEAGQMNPGQSVNAHLTSGQAEGLKGTVLVVREGFGEEADPVGDGIKVNRERKIKAAEKRTKDAKKAAESAARKAESEKAEVAKAKADDAAAEKAEVAKAAKAPANKEGK